MNYHIPNPIEDSETKAEQTEIPASEILEKIQKGEYIEFHHVIIKGDLDIAKLNLSKENARFIIAAQIKISQSRIDGNINFEGIAFKEAISFEMVEFGKVANFLGVDFNEEVSFTGVDFHGEAYFTKAEFFKMADFAGASFGELADFGNTKFKKNANFSETHFKNDAIFTNASFDGKCNFSGSDFEKAAAFTESTFKGDTIFIYSLFVGNASFTESKFDEFANFRGAIFSDTSNFILKDIDFQKFYVDWQSIKNIERTFDGKIYLSLIENYKTLGFFEDADECYYQYRNERRQTMSAPKRCTDLILMVLYGYGVKPLRPLIGFIIVLIAFTALYSRYVFAGNTLSVTDAFNTSLAILLSGSQLIETPAYSTSGILPYWIINFEKLIGSLLFGMLLISIGRTIIR